MSSFIEEYWWFDILKQAAVISLNVGAMMDDPLDDCWWFFDLLSLLECQWNGGRCRAASPREKLRDLADGNVAAVLTISGFLLCLLRSWVRWRSDWLRWGNSVALDRTRWSEQWNKPHFCNSHCWLLNWEMVVQLLTIQCNQKPTKMEPSLFFSLWSFFFFSFFFIKNCWLLLTLIFSAWKVSESNGKLCAKLPTGRKLTFNKPTTFHLNYFFFFFSLHPLLLLFILGFSLSLVFFLV